jgi:E3 ubiquitin-protein ligase TRIP12
LTFFLLYPKVRTTYVDPFYLYLAFLLDQEFSWKRFNGAEPVALRTRSSSAATLPDTTPTTPVPDPRIDLFKNNPQLLQRIGFILFPLLLEIYSSTVNLQVRQLVTHTLVKLAFFMDGDALKVVLQDVPLPGRILAQETPCHLLLPLSARRGPL